MNEKSTCPSPRKTSQGKEKNTHGQRKKAPQGGNRKGQGKKMGRQKSYDLTGMIFGRLRVIRREASRYNQVIWECQCECGAVIGVPGGSLRSGYTKSCGCFNRDRILERCVTHGHTSALLRGKRISVTYKKWSEMKSRCYRKNATAYPNYGGKGIKVDSRWHSFENFLSDMGECPAGFSLDRIDNSKGYEPGNCRWVTWTQQCRNRKSNLHITAFGKTQLLVEWSEELSLSYPMLQSRIARGMTPEVAFTLPRKNLPLTRTKKLA